MTHNISPENGGQLDGSGWLNQILSPLSVDGFLEKHWNQSFLHLHGAAERFRPLCTWDQVNTIISEHTLRPGQIKLNRNGITIPPSTYIDQPESSFPRVKARELVNLLSLGAMLELNCVEMTHAPIRELTMHMESLFRTSAFAMIFANFRTDKGFNLHWDHHEVFVFQAEGRKHWKVYAPTAEYPYRTRVITDMPTESPIFDAVLEAGSMLYLPRGWWHVAYPLDEPSLHLSIGVKTPTGIDLLQWFTDQMKEHVIFRQDIPCLSSQEERSRHLNAMHEQIRKSWDEHVMDRFLDKHDARRQRRPATQLPALTVE